jgi:hypothetical protein
MLLEITVGSEESDYFVDREPADFGLAFSFRKPLPDGTVYHVNLDLQNRHHTCECPGFLRYGMSCDGGKGCNHISSLVALIAGGKLNATPVHRCREYRVLAICPACNATEEV